jgi:hypothetical protein
MPVDPDADVRILVYGLALCCYNKARARWEFLLPQVDKHLLKVFVQKVGDSEAVPIPVSVGQTINFLTTNTVMPEHPYFAGENGFNWFQRQNNDDRDFRYFVDLEDKTLTHADGVEVIENKNKILLAVPDAMLYTEQLTTMRYTLYNHANPGVSWNLGTIGEIVGGEMKFSPDTDSGEVVLEIDNIPAHTIKREPGVKYEIIFDNHCHDDCTVDNDFFMYYEFVKAKNARDQFDLKMTEESRREYFALEKSVMSRIDCDAAQLSQLDTLF